MAAKVCKKCILPEMPPDITLNAEGVCNLCEAHERSKSFEVPQPLESDLIKILEKYRGKKKYDCLVMCSGGKDSTSALYFMKKRYNLNILAFTFDHGFEAEQALENIKNAVDILKIDFLFYRSAFMRDMFSKILSTGSKAVMCHPCSIWYMDTAFDVAARYDIPIIVAGWTKGQSSQQEIRSKCGIEGQESEFRTMAENTKHFLEHELKDMPQYKDFPRSMDEVLRRAKKRHKSLVISPHWFLPYTADEYVKIISEELKWKAPDLSYPAGSTNCILNFLSVHLSLKYYGYTHYHVEASKLIREGILTREEALEQLKINYDKELIDDIASKLNYKFE